MLKEFKYSIPDIIIMEISFVFLTAIGAMLCWGIGDFLIQRSTRKVGDMETLAFIGLFGSIFLLPFAKESFHLMLLPENLSILIPLALITFISGIINFEALRKGKMSIVEVIFEFELPVTIFFGFVFFKEVLSLLHAAIITAIFIGIILISTKSFSHWKTKLERGVVLAFIAAILMGSINFLTASSSKQISPIIAVWFPLTAVSIISLIFIWKREGFKKLARNWLEQKKLLLATAFFDTAGWVLYATALFARDVSIITAITESYPAIAILLGLWINREKIKLHQYIGIALALSSSFALSLML